MWPGEQAGEVVAGCYGRNSQLAADSGVLKIPATDEPTIEFGRHGGVRTIQYMRYRSPCSATRRLA
jgi:hypothetical protein